jgi:hypothetical protein
MSGKPQFLISLLIGSLTLAISTAAINEFFENRADPSNNRLTSQTALSVRADEAEGAASLNLSAATRGSSTDLGRNTSIARAPLDAKPANLLPVVELDQHQQPLTGSGGPPATASSHAENMAQAGSPKPIDPTRISTFPPASSTAPDGSLDAFSNLTNIGLAQRKIPLFARNSTGEHSLPPPPPVLDTPTENQGADPNGVSDLPNGDNGVDSRGDGTKETVNNPPASDPGEDRSVLVGETVTLNGSGSADSDGDPLAFRWSFISRPSESRAFIADPSTAIASFTADAAGVYIVQLVVDDGSEESLPQLIVITAELRGLTVPEVVGLSLTEARNTLTDAGFKQILIRTVPNAKIPKNQVVEQQPAAKSPVLQGSAISLVISFPPLDDDDQDGLPDAWEYAKFGNLSQRGNDDTDGDGFTNRQEYLVDTDPSDGTEAPVPAGNFFEYDAFGRILVKQITLEP